MRAVFTVGICTGLRLGDVATLRWSDIENDIEAKGGMPVFFGKEIHRGVLTRFNQTLRMDQIQSVSYTQTLIQQILGCGNIVVSSAATHRAGLVLFNIDNVKDVYGAIEKYR